MQNFELPGAFYLGKLKDAQGATSDSALLYDARDLTTHAVCVGMTGSGKTGLCLALLEEAAIDGIPALVIDPKGDIGNLLLTFPELRGEDFAPWVDEGEAQRNNVSVDEHARATAELWRKGLASWGQTPERIAMLRSAADFAIYTPGSSAGLSLSVLHSFEAPPPEQRGDGDALRERILSTVSGLLALIGIEADPIQSREHILLSNILDSAWREGQHLDMAGVIRGILTPPFTQLGVFDLESFYPEKERRALAMQLNNVLASPSFATWMHGDALDIPTLLYTRDGRPRVSILSIAHLSDAERMFFVTLVLNEMVAWMRRQSGTSSLRALLYMDEIFGFFPPAANPPSKTPMLTLLKQARAFGVGCVLATQNPVDLDYKGLGNTGTWFIGRLQTERDKLRVLDGLESAGAAAGKGIDRSAMDGIISGLGKRVFLMHNVHDDAPVLFETRWVMSYLRGPLTRAHIEALMAGRKAVAEASGTQAVPSGVSAKRTSATGAATAGGPKPTADEGGAANARAKHSGARPLPGALPEVFFPCVLSPGKSERVLYRPQLLLGAALHYVQAKSRVDEWRRVSLLAMLPQGPGNPDWDQAIRFTDDLPKLETEPVAEADFSALPASVGNSAMMTTWKKAAQTWLYRCEALTLWASPALKLTSAPDEPEQAFRMRLSQQLREQRDGEKEKLRARYLPRYSRVQERVRRAEEKIAREEAQLREQQVSSAVDIGATLLGALFGRRNSAGTAVRRGASHVRRSGREREDIARAQAELAAAHAELQELERQFRDEAALLTSVDVSALPIEEVTIAPRKADIGIDTFALAWMPWIIDADGAMEAGWEGGAGE